MDYQDTDLSLENLNASNQFKLEDFQNRYSNIQNYINGIRTKIGSIDTDIGNRVLTSTYNTKMASLDSSITALNNKTQNLNSSGQIDWSHILNKTNLSDNNFTSTYKSIIDNLSSNYAAKSHTHSISNINNLQVSLNNKLNKLEYSKTVKYTSNTWNFSFNENIEIPLISSSTSRVYVKWIGSTATSLPGGIYINNLTVKEEGNTIDYGTDIGHYSTTLNITGLFTGGGSESGPGTFNYTFYLYFI